MASILTALSQQFSRNARTRGEQYAIAGRVTLLQDAGEGAGSVVARVRGTSRYDLLITRQARSDGLAIVVDCTCPYFADNGVACKHIWATLLVADREGLLGDVAADADVYLDYLDNFSNQRGPDAAVGAALPRQDAGRGTPPPARSPGDVFLSQMSEGLEQIATSMPPPFRYLHGELLYVIEPLQAHLPGLHLTTQWRQRTKTGEWGKAKPAGIASSDLDVAPEADRPILGALLGARQEYAGYAGSAMATWQPQTASFALPRYVAQQVLPRAARTGRLFVRYDHRSDLLSPVGWDDGPPWDFVLSVASVDRGYRVSAGFTRAGEQLALDEVRMLLSMTFLLAHGRLSTVTLPRIEHTLLIGTLAGRGPIDVVRDDAARLADALARAGVPAATLPEDLRLTEIDVAPTPILRLRREHHYGINPRLEADIVFDYDGIEAPDDSIAVIIDAASRRLVRRRTDAERAAALRLTEVGLRASFDHRSRRNVLWVSPLNLPRISRELTAEGWRVEAEGRRWRAPGQIRMSVTSGIDWFDLEATIDFGETQADFPRVLAALRRGEAFVALDDGTTGMMPEDWVKRFGALVATATSEDGRLRFRSEQALLLDALLAAQADRAEVTFDAGFRNIRDELARFDRIAPVDAPESFKGALRPYQQDALGWFRFLRGFGFGGCLADDMGLGKTIMVLALLAWRREEFLRTGDGLRTSAIVMPRSLVTNWMSEAAVFAPDLRVVDFSSTGRGDHSAAMADADVLLMTYGTLRKDVVNVKDAEFEYVILDEAQAIKNAASASAKAVRLLRGRYRLALSGTPIENHLGELWSLFEFLNPGLLGSSSFFQRTTAKAQPDPETAVLLSKGLKPFFLRRTKGQVARDLPARTEQTIHCELDKPGRALYESLRKHYRDALMKRIGHVGVAKSGMQVLEALLRLRQAACHPGLLDATKASESSAKFDVLLPRLREVVAEGHKALVFSQFTSLLGLLTRHLDQEAVQYEYLDGQTRNRAERVKRFQTDASVPLFLVSLKAGGLGLNLTAADYVFLLDPWWNPAVEAQAIDRAHRIGQTREVFAYRIIAKDTVEEKVLALQQSKRALADAVLAESATGLRHLTREDLELLLS